VKILKVDVSAVCAVVVLDPCGEVRKNHFVDVTRYYKVCHCGLNSVWKFTVKSFR
jgi:hypothetical protein